MVLWETTGFCGEGIKCEIYMLFLGVPIGFLVGISLVDRLLSKRWKINILGLALGFILSQFGIVLGIFLIDLIGETAFFLIPLEAGFLSLVGYNIRFLFKGNI